MPLEARLEMSTISVNTRVNNAVGCLRRSSSTCVRCCNASLVSMANGKSTKPDFDGKQKSRRRRAEPNGVSGAEPLIWFCVPEQ